MTEKDQKSGTFASPESILEQYDRYAGSRHHVPVTTHVEPLLDALVHTQDILRPLGIDRDMPVEAAAFAANRAYRGAFFFGMAGRLRPLRLVASDTDWTRGKGDRLVEGPMQELLLFVTGGIAWADVDERYMLASLPGTFVAGEMLDWEAPTGGYLLSYPLAAAVVGIILGVAVMGARGMRPKVPFGPAILISCYGLCLVAPHYLDAFHR